MTALLSLFLGRFGRTGLIALAVAGLLMLAGAGFWRGMARIDGMVERAAETARAERDAHWRAEIERSNAAALNEHLRQAEAGLEISRAAEARIRQLNDQLADMEKANAALPGGDRCGLGGNRVRLLNGGTAAPGDPDRAPAPHPARGGARPLRRAAPPARARPDPGRSADRLGRRPRLPARLRKPPGGGGSGH